MVVNFQEQLENKRIKRFNPWSFIDGSVNIVNDDNVSGTLSLKFEQRMHPFSNKLPTLSRLLC